MTHNKYIIVAPSWLGDAVLMQPLLHAIKKNEPHSTIDIMSLNHIIFIFDFFKEVNNVIPFKKGLSFKQILDFSKKLKKKYTHVIILPPSIRLAVLMKLAKIPNRSGWSFLPFLTKRISLTDLATYPAYKKHNLFYSDSDDNFTFPRFSNFKPSTLVYLKNKYKIKTPLKKLIALAPGASTEAKRWPKEYFAKFIEMFNNEYPNEYIFLLVGSKSEKKAISYIEQKVKLENIVNLLDIEFSDLLSFLSYTEILVANDSGLSHVSSVFNTMVIDIFGSTSGYRYRPFSKNNINIRHKVDCAYCFEKKCKYKHLKCLYSVTPSKVFSKLKYWVDNHE